MAANKARRWNPKALIGGDSGEICRPIFNLWRLSRDTTPKGDDEFDPAANGSGIYILWRLPIRLSLPSDHRTSLRLRGEEQEANSRCCSRRTPHSRRTWPALVCVAAVVCSVLRSTPIHSRPWTGWTTERVSLPLSLRP